MNEQNKSKKGVIHIVLALLFTGGAIFTLLPLVLADDKCFFGYYAVCPFSPISSIVLLAIAGYFFILRKKQIITK